MGDARWSFELTPTGPFRLAETLAFLGGFRPAGMAGLAGDVLRVAFPVDGGEQVAAVAVRQSEPDGTVTVDVASSAPEAAVRGQVARLLSLDHDGTRFAELGTRDEVIGRLLAERPGFRPSGFFSPYEAAVWSVLSQRVQMGQAAATKSAIAREFGQTIRHDGADLVAFPAPAALAEADLSGVAGLAAHKPAWLRGVAVAALAGDLDADRLRKRPPDEAMAALQRIPGIGPFSAGLILIRGAMPTDVAPVAERRLGPALLAAYGLPAGTPEGAVNNIVQSWAPFRTWASVLVRSSLEQPSRNRTPG